MQEHDLRPSKSIHSLFYSALLVGNDKVRALTSTILTRRLQRWSFPAWVTSLYFTASLKSALPLPPRVVWTFISLVLNGWLTARRFQEQSPCLYCLQHEDSIEHFRVCLVISNVYAHFGLPHDLFLYSTPPSQHKDTLHVLHALHTYHHNRRHGLPPSPNLPRTILQHLIANGHPLRLVPPGLALPPAGTPVPSSSFAHGKATDASNPACVSGSSVTGMSYAETLPLSVVNPSPRAHHTRVVASEVVL